MKWIQYKIVKEYSIGTEDAPQTIRDIQTVRLTYCPENLETAKQYAYNGEYQIIDVPDTRPLHEIKSDKQSANKAALAAWLASHPLTWVDGNVYGVTEEDQNEMALNLQQYQVQVAAGRAVSLEWHTQKKQCHTFTEEQYTALLLAIIDYVYPYRRYQEEVKAAIYAAETAEAVEAVVIDYASVSVEEEDADA